MGPWCPVRALVVGVEAGAGLAPELLFADHLGDQAGGLVSRLAGVGVVGVADRFIVVDRLVV
jgi:hypothetical protein